ncbi:hypothetical protein ACFL0G_01105 [Candidatus Zixiibacteriota bacterium]
MFILLGIMLYQPARAGSVIQTNLFGEVYNETISLGREERNIITMMQALQGARARIAGISTVDLYLKQRFGGDSNRDYWNNRGELMIGARARFFEKVYLALYGEYIQGRYFDSESSRYPNPYGSNYEDIRYGLIFWQGWDRAWYSPNTKRFPLSFWEEIYADFTHFQKDRDNNILSMKGKAGLRMLQAHKTVVDLYAIQYFNYDTNGDFWNNRAESGLGTQIKPWTDYSFSLFVEFLRGSYYERDGRYENPYRMKYNEVRAGLILWWGREF